ncbi:MAG: 30S ribosomal protein S2 [Patescibacteria group bacterium]|nr:30S ribosomal protein S2 [Patescibacteria group bacterium]
MIKIPTLEEMLKAGLHFGHKLSRRYPKMNEYIFTSRNSVHIIDLEKTQEKLKEALEFLQETASNGGTVLFIGTKPQALPIVEKYAKECGMPYINERWLGGTITNFSVVSKSIKKYNDLVEKQKTGELKKYTKREQVMFGKEIEDMARKVDGIKNLQKTPDILFVLDIKNEKTAVTEAGKKNIPIVAVCDTNVNPDKVQYVIPANDDAISSIEMIVGLVAEAVKEGKANPSSLASTPAKATEDKEKKEKKEVKEKTEKVEKKKEDKIQKDNKK